MIMARLTKYPLAIAATALLVLGGRSANAQVQVPWNVDTGFYSVGANWLGGFPPYANFDDIGVINNGGTAQVNDTPPSPSGIIIGQGSADSGTLEVLSGGNLSVVLGGMGTTAGQVVVGQSGEGLLTVHRGGTLTTERLASGGASTSSIILGDTGGSGTASVTVNGSANLNASTTVVGPNVGFSSQNLVFGSSHVLTADILGTTHSPLYATEDATLGGTLYVDFSGYSPSVRDTWTLVDAADVSGQFAAVNSSTSLGTGVGLVVSTVAGGVNGEIAQLSVGVQLFLSVDRRTGATSIQNRALSGSVDIDGYLITSSAGTLTPADWTSFADAGQPGWTESNPSTTHLGELNLNGMRNIAADSSISIGDVYSFTPTELGETLEDVSFEYHVAGGGTVVGIVDYTGPHNNVVLIVDPDTGEAAIQNQSQFDVDIDGYLITSESGSLDPAGWTSFGDSGQSGWTEANAADNHIGELNLSGSRYLAGESSALGIGTPFDFNDAGVQQDLEFEFHLASGETMTGVVEYGALPPAGLLGDYNGDGSVDAADYTVWRDTLSAGATTLLNDPTPGTVDESDYTYWRSHFGETLGSGASIASAAVPEPASMLLMAGALLVPWICRRR